MTKRKKEKKKVTAFLTFDPLIQPNCQRGTIDEIMSIITSWREIA
jgi:hypothetical protein